MIGALIILAVTVAVGVVLYVIHRLTVKPEDDIVKQPRPEGCCGQHEVCEKDEEALRALKNKIVYFEDEELDRYHGVDADGYTEEQIEQFRDVLYTLRPEDITAWAHSIGLRGITLPSPIKDELLMLAAESHVQK